MCSIGSSSVRSKAKSHQFHNYPVNQLFGVQNEFPSFMANQHRLLAPRDCDYYLQRLDALPTKFDQLLESLKLREEKQILPPRFVVEKVLKEMDAFVAQPATENILSTSFRAGAAKIEKLTDAQRADYQTRVETAVTSRVYPAYQKLIAYFRALLPKTTTDDGAWKLPDGEAFYSYMLYQNTTTKLKADEIHQLGLSEVARIEAEMRAILDAQGFAGRPIGESMEALGKDPRFLFSNDDKGRSEALASPRTPPWKSPSVARSWSTPRCDRFPARCVRRGRRRAGDRPPRQAPAHVLRLGRPHGLAGRRRHRRPARRHQGPHISIRYFQQCISLGRRQGLIQFVTADDRAVDRALTGRMAALYKELICKGAAWGVANPTAGLPSQRRRVRTAETRTVPGRRGDRLTLPPKPLGEQSAAAVPAGRERSDGALPGRRAHRLRRLDLGRFGGEVGRRRRCWPWRTFAPVRPACSGLGHGDATAELPVTVGGGAPSLAVSRPAATGVYSVDETVRSLAFLTSLGRPRLS